MAYVPSGVFTSLHGRRLGLMIGRLVSPTRDGVFPMVGYASAAASAALTASSTETAFSTGSYTVKKGTLDPGSIIRVRFQGIATATNSTDTLQIKLYIGGILGTAILTGTATDVADNAAFWGEANIVIRTIGASGTFVANGSHSIVPAATNVAVPVYALTASTAIDTTVDQVVAVSGKWSTTSASNSCRLDMFTVELV